MTRATPALRAPTPAALARVPDLPIGAVVVHRATWEGHGPWWFASRTGSPEPGRFDLEAPHGTCYFADDLVGALIERLAEPAEVSPVVTVEAVHRLRVHSGRLRHPATVADATDRRSRIPKELGPRPDDLNWSALERVSAGADHLDELREMFDIVVEPAPLRSEVEIAAPPE